MKLGEFLLSTLLIVSVIFVFMLFVTGVNTSIDKNKQHVIEPCEIIENKCLKENRLRYKACHYVYSKCLEKQYLGEGVIVI